MTPLGGLAVAVALVAVVLALGILASPRYWRAFGRVVRP